MSSCENAPNGARVVSDPSEELITKLADRMWRCVRLSMPYSIRRVFPQLPEATPPKLSYAAKATRQTPSDARGMARVRRFQRISALFALHNTDHDMSSEHVQNNPSHTRRYTIMPLPFPASQNPTPRSMSSQRRLDAPTAPTEDDSMPPLSTLPADSDSEDEIGRSDVQGVPAWLREFLNPAAELRSPPPAPSDTAQDDYPSLFRPSRRPSREDENSDAASVESLPSLQTVSDSSDVDLTFEESEEEDESDDEDPDLHDDEDDEAEEESAFDSLPRLGHTNLPPGAAQLMQTLTRAVADARDGWVGMDFEGEEDDAFDPLSILGGPGPDPFGPLFSSQAGETRNPRSELVFRAMRHLMDTLGSPAVPENDPKRAEMIMQALEIVPGDLVRRYEKLRAGQEGEESDGCAVCRESFLDHTVEETALADRFAELPYPDGVANIEAGPNILAFPCPGMHLFHSHCISPWLGRKTTCPTCRYDVDPDSLTLTFLRDIRQRSNHPLANKKWYPPRQRSFKRWLEREERRLRGEELSDSESDDVEEYVNGETAEDYDELPALVDDDLTRPSLAPDSPPRGAASVEETFERNQPTPDPHPDVAGFYNIDPAIRESMMAALLPIMASSMNRTAGEPLADDEESEWDDDDDDELPPLVPSSPGATGPVPTEVHASPNDISVGPPSPGDAAHAALPTPSHNSLTSAPLGFLHQLYGRDDDDDLPELVPVDPSRASSQPVTLSDNEDLPDLIGEPHSRVSLEDID